MSTLPQSPNFSGSIKLDAADQVWLDLYKNGKPFTPTTDPIVQMHFEGSGGAKLQGAGAAKIDLTADASAASTLQLFWPDSPRSEGNPIDKFGVGDQLTDDALYLAVVFNGKANAGITGKVPQGALSATFGIKTGGEIAFTQLVPFKAKDPVKKILDHLFKAGTIRLPQSIGAQKQAPAPGEIIALSYGGYLELSSKVTWGYSYAGTKDLNARSLASAFNYNLTLAASAALAYKIAGEFSIEARGDSKGPSWVRMIVRRGSNSLLSFTADISTKASYNIPGLAEKSFEDVLQATLGVGAASLSSKLERVLAFSDPKKIREELGEVASAWCEELSQQLYGRTLNGPDLSDLLGKLTTTARRIANLDRQIASLFEEHLGGAFDNLESRVDELLSAEDLIAVVQKNEPEIWRILETLFGDRLVNLLGQGAPFEPIKGKLRELKALLVSGSQAEVAKWLKTAKERLKIDKLITELAAIKTPADLKDLADARLKALANDLLDKGLDEISSTAGFRDALGALKEVKNQLERFRAAWKETIGKVAAQKFTAELAYRYSRARSEDRLVDLSVNLAHVDGPALFEKALAGNFLDLLSSTDRSLVELRAGSIEREVAISSELNLTVAGFQRKTLRKVIQKSTLALETSASGQIVVYNSTSTAEEEAKLQTKKEVEKRWSALALQATGIASPAANGSALLRTISSLNLGYDLKFDDTATTYEELAEYLRFCDFLRIGPGVATYISHLKAALQGGSLGAATISYNVSYDPDALRGAFKLTTPEVIDIARATRRSFYRSYYLASGDLKGKAHIGLAYADQRFHDQVAVDKAAGVFRPTSDAYLKAAFFKDVAVPGINGSGPTLRTFNFFFGGALVTQILAENAFVEALGIFDAVHDRQAAGGTVTSEEFDRAALDLVKAKSDADTWAEKNYSPMFVILDALINHASSGRALRKSSVRIKITPPGANESINQYFAAHS